MSVSQSATEPQKLQPRHVAVIMDGNGRWAKQRALPRHAGHQAGVEVTRDIVRYGNMQGLEVLSLFAFSSENWQRPLLEVDFLIHLLIHTLNDELPELHASGVRIKFIGNLGSFPASLQEVIHKSEVQTHANTGMTLVIAVGYGGHWDILQAATRMAEQVSAGKLELRQCDVGLFRSYLQLGSLPDPDLLIRTGGEYRISNFLLWHLAYTELYFCNTLWPDFNRQDFDHALAWYAGRQRRFGRITAHDANQPR
jgi:undecaprenyl diphosphate synthase